MRLENKEEHARSNHEDPQRKNGAARRLTGTSSTKSSLDFKRAKTRQAWTTTKPVKPTPSSASAAPTSDEEQQQQEAQQRKQRQQRSATASRARGSSGPPPRRYDVEDLQSMDEAQMWQALYDDPELAEKATQAMQEQHTAKKNRSSSSSSQRGSSKGKERRSTIGDKPQHLRDLEDGGVPILQWVVLVVILLTVLWHLRTLLTLPDKSSKKKPLRSGKGKAKKGYHPKRQSQHQQQQRPSVADNKEAETIRTKAEADLLAAESTSSTPAKKATKKNASATKKKKKTKPVNGIKKPANDKSTNAGGGEPDKGSLNVTETKPIHQGLSSSRPNEEDVAGWKTVGKGTADETLNTATEKENMPAQDIVPDLQLEPTAPATSTPATPAAPAASSAKKKKKPKSNKKAKAPQNGDAPNKQPDTITKSSSVDDDAALAALLQKEEDSRVVTSNNNQHEDVWEEVPRRRKGVHA